MIWFNISKSTRISLPPKAMALTVLVDLKTTIRQDFERAARPEKGPMIDLPWGDWV